MRDKFGRFKKGTIPHNKKFKVFYCLKCNKKIKDKPSSNRKHCSRKCAEANRSPCPWKGKKLSKKWKDNLSISHTGKVGKKASNWKGGVRKTVHGYIIVYKPTHPRANNQGYVLKSHLVMEKMIGRYLQPGEVVHHRGTKYPMGSYKDKGDNRPINLKLFASNSAHRKYHCHKGTKIRKNS